MHHSRISVIVIDVPSGLRDAAESFWSGAIGHDAKPGQRHPEYSTFGMVNSHVVLVQALKEGESRIHLDVHTDDLEAEVRRLIDLGAVEVARHDSWVIMNDPAEVTFCVVPVPTNDDTLVGAKQWP